MNTRHTWIRWTTATAACVVTILVVACSDSAGTTPAPQAETQSAPAKTPPVPIPPYDHAITDSARVLAGIPPEDVARFQRVTARPTWGAHQAEFDKNWSSLEQQRLTIMRGWRDRELPKLTASCDTLFYPFGGPDFLNAYVLYPTCHRYLLFGLEPVGSLPALDRVPDDHVDAVLVRLRESLSDVFFRDYFITKTMMTELRTPEIDGTLPLLATFLARLDARIVSIEMDGPWNPRAPVPAPATAPGRKAPAPKPSPKIPGVTIRFFVPGSAEIQTLSYIRVQMQDAVFSKKTSLLTYIRGLTPYTTFLKSASYLMFDDRFSVIRSMVLDGSSSILQDDTGVPFQFFDKARWDIALYGVYLPPIKDFNYGFQKDLDAAFKVPSAAHELPFSYGYHRQLGTSSVILATRKLL